MRVLAASSLGSTAAPRFLAPSPPSTALWRMRWQQSSTRRRRILALALLAGGQTAHLQLCLRPSQRRPPFRHDGGRWTVVSREVKSAFVSQKGFYFHLGARIRPARRTSLSLIPKGNLNISKLLEMYPLVLVVNCWKTFWDYIACGPSDILLRVRALTQHRFG